MKFNNVWQVVEPKRKARDQANEELSAARSKLMELRNMIIVKFNSMINYIIYYISYDFRNWKENKKF